MSRKPEKKVNGEKKGPPIPAILQGVVRAQLDDDKALEAYPLLVDLLRPKYEDGKQVTEAGRVTITVKGAHWEIRLDLPTFLLQCVVMPSSLFDALQQLEDALASGRVVWHPGYNRKKKIIPTVDDAT